MGGKFPPSKANKSSQTNDTQGYNAASFLMYRHDTDTIHTRYLWTTASGKASQLLITDLDI